MDELTMLRQAADQIRYLRRENETLRAQVSVVETFRAALFGVPRGGACSPDLVWEIDQHLANAATVAAAD